MFRLPLIAVCVLPLLAQTKLPETAPVVRNLFPAGGQSGKSFEITFRGIRLDQVTDIEFATPGFATEICRSGFYELTALISVDSTVASGIHDYRLVSPAGAYVGGLHITNLPETREVEPNNLTSNAQKLTLPIVVNGVIDNNDVDLFSFSADAGETILLQVMASRLSAGLDSQLTIFDANGNELEFQDDDGISQDSRLLFRPKKKGEYFVQIGHSFPFGGPFNYYRLTIGKLPSVKDVFPVAVQRGRSAEITLFGDNLDLLHAAALGPAKLGGSILEKSPTSAKIRFDIPSGMPEGPAAIRFATASTDSLSETKILLTGTPESISASARIRSAPEKIAIPAGISGRIEKNRATDFYEFEAKAGEALSIKVQALAIGSSMDPVLSLYDSAGKLLVFQDEPIPWYFTEAPMSDPDLTYRFESAGRYLLAIRDAGHAGGRDFFYHLSIQPPRPDFRLRLNAPSTTLYRGRKNTIQVRVKREDGWDTPIELWAEIPQNLRATGIAEPKNSTITDCNAKLWELDGTDVNLEVDVPSSVTPGEFPIRIHARGKNGQGKEVSHTLTAMYYSGFAGPALGHTQFDNPQVTFVDLPRLILEVPPALAIVAGKSEKLIVNVNRFDDAKAPLPVAVENLPDGITVPAAELASGASAVELQVTAAKEAKPGKRLIRVRIGESLTPDIEISVNPAPEKKK